MRASRVTELPSLRSIDEEVGEATTSESAFDGSEGRPAAVAQSTRHVAFCDNDSRTNVASLCNSEEISVSSSSDESDESRSSEAPQNGVGGPSYYYCNGPEKMKKKSALAHPRHPPLSGRRKGMLMIQESLCYDNCFRVEMGDADDAKRNPFGFRVAVNAGAARRAALNMRRPSVFQQMAKFHNKLGIRHYILVSLLAIYAALGGVMFLRLETGNEVATLAENKQMLIMLMSNLSQEIFEIANVSLTAEQRNRCISVISKYYKEMLQAEGKYSGSVFHKYDDLDHHLVWHYRSAVFFAITVFTTIGYGSIACQTSAGKVMVVLYSIVGIPLMLVVLSDVGNVMLVWLTRAYNASLRYYEKMKRRILQKLKEQRVDDYGSDDEDEEKKFPLQLTIPLLVIYLVLCTLIVASCDYHDDSTPLLSFGNSFYFAFQSVSTIGLGDVMPNRIQYNPLLDILFLFGLAFLGVINKTVYMEMEEKFLMVIDGFESWLEKIHVHRHGREGYTVFKKLASNIQLLALAAPIFDDEEEENIQQMLDPGETALGKRIFRPDVPLPYRRRAMTSVESRHNIPTPGIYISDGRRLRSTTFGGFYKTRRSTHGSESESPVKKNRPNEDLKYRPPIRRACSEEERDERAPSHRKRACTEIV